MRYTLAALALVAAVSAAPQGVSSAIAPQSSAPAGCKSSYSGTFEIEVVNVTTSGKRSIEARDDSSALVLTLDNGVLKDAKGRIGSIVDNQQFQFDGPVAQTGAIYTAGWSVCANNTLALGANTVFQQCLSGGFYNLYLTNSAEQCSPIHIQVIPGTTASASAAPASQIPDGQVTASAVPHPICQLGDGQPQATACASTSASVKPVSQLSDGQVQATSAAAKPSSTAAAPVTQAPDGQVQGATSAKPAATSTAAQPVSQIPDGQVQGGTAAKSTAAVPTVSAAPSASSSRAASAYTGAAVPTAAVRSEVFGLAAGVLALAML